MLTDERLTELMPQPSDVGAQGRIRDVGMMGTGAFSGHRIRFLETDLILAPDTASGPRSDEPVYPLPGQPEPILAHGQGSISRRSAQKSLRSISCNTSISGSVSAPICFGRRFSFSDSLNRPASMGSGGRVDCTTGHEPAREICMVTGNSE